MPLLSGKRKHANELKLQTLPLMGATRPASGFFNSLLTSSLFCAIEWRILKVNELRCKNGYHWVCKQKVNLVLLF